MISLRSALGILPAVLLLAGCSTVKVSDREEYSGPSFHRPGRILVFDFVTTPSQLPSWADASAARNLPQASEDADDLAAGKKLGAQVAAELVKKINEMGLTAVRANDHPGPVENDLAILGFFTSIDKGSAVERVALGFGKGSAQVNAHVQGYRATAGGMQLLGSGVVDSGGSGKSPGLVVPALVTIATANPIGLVVGGAIKAEGEVSGRSTDEGSAERMAGEIAKELKPKFEEQGWI